ncbi:uncharacterized protein [Amphiura filiformis]|uniref:uncharacterized protein n=1 Tax=Amphiura filiformis TaxID=82378 RepID=UPI003B2231B5
MANKEMSEWMLFFREAGVPAGPAASYANTFVDNRIHKSMLLDLTKEYLKEMGIGVMGDVIAILKHARTAHSKFERDRPALDVLPKPADGKVELKRKTTAGSRMLEHYLRKEGVIEGGSESPSRVKVSTEMAARLGAVPLAGTKKRLSAPAAVEVVPVKRIRKVDPAEEGAYIISMPKGIIPRTQKILQQKRAFFSNTVHLRWQVLVFARLGGGSSSPAGATVTVKNTATAGQANVFNRLGGVPTQPRERSLSEGSTGSTLEYQGVLKPGTAGKQSGPTVTVTLGGPKAVTIPKQTLQDRLGIQKPEISTTTLTHMDSVTVKPSLQARLGAQGKTQLSTSNTIQVRIGDKSPPAMQKRLGTNMSNLIQVPIMDKPAPAVKSPAMLKRLGTQTTVKSPAMLKRLGTQTTVRVNSPGLQKRLGIQVKAPGANLQARLGGQKKVAVASPKQTQAVTTSPNVKKLIITRPAHSIQERLGAQTGMKSPAQKTSLADRLGGKVSTASAGIFSRSSPQSMTGMASDRVESAGVMKRLGVPVSGGGGGGTISTSPTKITFNRLGSQKKEISLTPSAAATNRTNVRERLGVQKAEASSTTPSLGLTVTTSGRGVKTVQATGGPSVNVAFDSGISKKARRNRKKQAAAKSGVFSRLGTAT